MLSTKKRPLVLAILAGISQLFAVIQYQSATAFNWENEFHRSWAVEDAMDNQLFWQRLGALFPCNFAWGAATSAFQIEGTESTNGRSCSNSWTINPFLPQPGISVGHWQRYRIDVQLIKKIHLTHYRFSIEWSKIEPARGIFDKDAMRHYEELVDELLRNGIVPVVCLFHHTWPVWFHEMGHFEKEENIKYFIEFAEYVFKCLHNRVKMWMTFNEPAGYAMGAYVDEKYPPKKKISLANLKLCGIWLKHVLFAHVEAAERFKQIDSSVQIGIPKVFNPLDPWNKYNPLEYAITHFMNYLLHDVTLNFFKDGHYNWGFGVTGYREYAPKSLDYLGVNYYSHTVIRWFKRRHRPTEVITGDDKKGRTIYPEGLYRSIKKAHELTKVLNIPIYITENGVNDPDDLWKNEYLKKHLFMVGQAIQEGIDIRGYFWWTLIDSFSWSKDKDSKMGLYSVDAELNRHLRGGLEPFLEFIQRVQDCGQA